MKSKKLLALLMAGALAASLTACGGDDADTGSTGGSTSGDSGEVTGEFLYWSCFTGDSATWDEGRVNDFMDEHPGITIDYQAVPDAAGISNGKLLSALAAGNGPDLIIADSPQSAYAFAGQNSFVAWDPYMEYIGLTLDDFSAGYHELMQLDGEIMLIPNDSNTIMLFVRNDYMEEAGLDPANPPKNLEELDAWADAMTVKDGDNVTRYGFIPWLDSGDDPFTFAYICGATLFDAETQEFVLTDDTTVEFYTWMQEYANRYDPEKIDSFTSSAGGQFTPDHPMMTGSLAMTICGNWFTNSMTQYAPDVEYTTFPVPVIEEERYGSTMLGPNVYALCAGVEEDAAKCAATFVGWGIQPEVNAANFDTFRSIPVFDDAFDAVSWTQNEDPIYALERELAGSEYSGVPALTSISNEFGDQLVATRDNIIYNDVDVATTLAELEETLQAELN